MPLARNHQFGNYEILDRLGAGGMGEVYCARDTRLNRDVAIKVLPPMFALDPERAARFEREAQVLAGVPVQVLTNVYDPRIESGVAYDVHPDGRFLMIRPADEDAVSNTVRLITNLFAELKRMGARK